jgi:hypothetical protein
MNLETYVFLNDDNDFIKEMGLHDDDVADDYCIALTNIHKTNITCYRLVSQYNYGEEKPDR